MKVKEFYDYITKHMTPEQALMKLLESSVLSYEKLKFSDGEAPVHPEIIITMAAMDLGWAMAIEKDPPGDLVRGMAVGTEEYLDKIFKTDATTEETKESKGG